MLCMSMRVYEVEKSNWTVLNKWKFKLRHTSLLRDVLYHKIYYCYYCCYCCCCCIQIQNTTHISMNICLELFLLIHKMQQKLKQHYEAAVVDSLQVIKIVRVLLNKVKKIKKRRRRWNTCHLQCLLKYCRTFYFRCVWLSSWTHFIWIFVDRNKYFHCVLDFIWNVKKIHLG